MAATSRPFTGDSDVTLMKRIVSESWLTAAPVVSCTVADLGWWTINDPDVPMLGNVRIWELDGRPVGWEWLDPPLAGDWHLQPGLEPDPFLEPFLDRLEAGAASAGGSASIRAMDADTAAIAVLERRGYAPEPPALSHWVRTLPAAGGSPVPASILPPGYRQASVSWPVDIARRVAVHRAAFGSEKMTEAAYAAINDLPHYSPGRDRVVVGSNGDYVAFATAWWDPIGQVGELEPVGTHPDHRRLGLARAVCLEAFRTLDALGARHVVINTGETNVAAEALYEGLGCVRVTSTRRYNRPR